MSIFSLAKKHSFLLLSIISIILFFSFGLFHLAKFETVDEHFWKYERIPRYWLEGIAKNDIKKTYINDKPGVTTAIISGFGLPFSGNPQKQRLRDPEITDNENYTVYNHAQTEKINLSLRLPILLTNLFLLTYLFWILKKLFDSPVISASSLIFIALSPILIGISQIINPDALLWSFGSSALFTYWVFLKKQERQYLYLTACLTGLAILSKYTGTILYLLFTISFFSHLIFADTKQENSKLSGILTKNILAILSIILGSIIIYALGMPAAILKLKYLYRGTIGSPAFRLISPAFFFLILIILTDAKIFQTRLVSSILNFLQKKSDFILKILSFAFIIIFSFILLNSWLGEKFIFLENIRENSIVEKKLIFPDFQLDPLPLKILKEIATEAYSLPFSIHPIALIFIFFLFFKIFFFKKIIHRDIIFNILTTTLIFIFGALLSGIVLNPRYLILIYPLLFILAAIGLSEFISLFNFSPAKTKLAATSIILFIIINCTFSIWSIKPFYLNYMNDLLPKNQIINDSWGYGSYEAAQYLNNLPNAKELKIWTDRSTICQFIQGKCISDYKIDLQKTVPDYFVFTRRGEIRHKFAWKNPELAKKSNLDYYNEEETKNLWKLAIDGREENSIRIVASEEK